MDSKLHGHCSIERSSTQTHTLHNSRGRGLIIMIRVYVRYSTYEDNLCGRQTIKYSTYCTYLYQYKSLGEQYIQDDSIRTTCSVAPQERRSYDMLKNVPDLKSIIESHTQGIRYRLFFCKTIIFSKYSIYIREAACCCCSYH